MSDQSPSPLKENHSSSSSAAVAPAPTADEALLTAPTAAAPATPPSDGEFHPLDTSALHESVENSYQARQIALDSALQRALATCRAAAEAARSQHLVMWDVAIRELERGVTTCQSMENDIEIHRQQLHHFVHLLQRACQFLLQPHSKNNQSIQEM